MECALRCPYCVSDFEFHRMVAHVDGRHICNECGRTVQVESFWFFSIWSCALSRDATN